MDDTPTRQSASFKPALLASAAILAAMFALSAWAWARVPEGHAIPVHWGINGQPDRYGGKGEGLLFAPLMAVFLTAIFAAVPRFDPRKMNLAASRVAFSAIWISVLVFLLVIHATLVGIAMGARPSLMNDIIPPGIGALFMVMGIAITRIKSNFSAGVRTPWTLSSNASWEKSNRAAGWLFTAHGAVMLIAALAGLGLKAFVLITLVGLAVDVPFLVIYSYVVWKNDPNRSEE